MTSSGSVSKVVGVEAAGVEADIAPAQCDQSLQMNPGSVDQLKLWTDREYVRRKNQKSLSEFIR